MTQDTKQLVMDLVNEITSTKARVNTLVDQLDRLLSGLSAAKPAKPAKPARHTVAP